jgi:Spy/CpxP family protein refolding chaperone
MSGINEFNSPEELNQPEKPEKVRGRKRKIVIGIVLVLFVVTGVVGIGFAKNFRDKYRGDGPYGFIMDKIVKELNLNEQQKTEVDKIKNEIKAKMETNRQKKTDNANEFEQMFRSDNFDKQKALDLAKQRDAEREEMRSFFVEELAKFHSILTSEQRNKAADKMKEFRENRGKNKDKWKNKMQRD